jgi:hypothetical protein
MTDSLSINQVASFKVIERNLILQEENVTEAGERELTALYE